MFEGSELLRETIGFELAVAGSKSSVDRNHRNLPRRDADRWCEVQ